MSHEPESNLLTVNLPDESASLQLGWALAQGLKTETGKSEAAALVIYMQGNLGAGKTTTVRGLLQGLGFKGRVKSPTYTLVEPYTSLEPDAISRLELHHFDFYRFNHPDEFLEAGLEEYFRQPGVCVVEWPDQAAPHVPPADLQIALEIVSNSVAGNPVGGGDAAGRKACLQAFSERGQSCLNTTRTALQQNGLLATGS